ncbi:MAG TPA: sigma-70 family RNA polymerase sigma factor [Chthonomonadaceae bacterium]|nr:sigma-70 family RNA polymerase sigma factor [Chthonomonadaceae bacterium]
MASTSVEQTDEALVEAARLGDRAAFGVLVERYRALVYAFAYARLRSREEAEDTAQEAFLRAYQYLPDFRMSDRFGGWLMRIARNLCTDVARRRKSRPTEELSEDWMDHSPTPEMSAMVQERRRELTAAIDGLPEKHQVLILMHYGSGRSYREMALALDLPETTVVGRMAAALRGLRRRLGKEAR